MTPWTGDQPVVRSLPTQDSTTQKRGHASMPQAGFEPMISVFLRLKIVRALDRSAIGTGFSIIEYPKYILNSTEI
jgi:hypothetical protein